MDSLTDHLTPPSTTLFHQPTTPRESIVILVCDDDLAIRTLLGIALDHAGYHVLLASDGVELVRMAQAHTPHLILADLIMPHMDGFEALRQLRNDTRTAHIPVILMTAMTRTEDVVTGFQTGADDYLVKPFEMDGLLARINSHLRREARRLTRNPLTHMAGNELLMATLRDRLSLNDHALAFVHVDLDNFKAFNDIYGFARGDRAILLVADVLRRVVSQFHDPVGFVGHIGGDDFALLVNANNVSGICAAIVQAFDQEAPYLYDPTDRERGYLSGTDRYGILRRFGMMTISLGVATNERRTYNDPEEMARIASEMKHYVKLRGAGRSGFAIDQRGITHNLPEERRHGRRVWLVSTDSSLRSVLATALTERGFHIDEFLDLAQAQLRFPQAELPLAILVEALPAPLLDHFVASLAEVAAPPACIVLAAHEEEVQYAVSLGVSACLRQPLPLAEVIACVEQFTHRILSQQLIV